MEIKIDLDLPSIIAQAVSAERIQPIVDKAIAEAVSSAVRSATDYSSPFRKALETQLKEAMPHGLAIDDMAKFQYMTNAAVSDAVKGANSDTIKNAIAQGIKAAIPEMPERIKLSELVTAARSEFHKDAHEAFYAHYEPSEYGGGWLSLDSDESTKSKYGAGIRLGFNSKGEVFSLRLDGIDITPKYVPDAAGRFEGMLLSLYVGRSSIELDLSEGDAESLAGEQWD